MSFTDRLMLWFHLAFVIFTIGPVTFATMSSPRAIRTRNTPVLRYLSVMTTISAVASLGIPAFGMSLGQSLGELGSVWLTVAITLYVVALVLLVIIVRDQRRAVTALESAASQEAAAAAAAAAAAVEAGGEAGQVAAGQPTAAQPGTAQPTAAEPDAPQPGADAGQPETAGAGQPGTGTGQPAAAQQGTTALPAGAAVLAVASVERGRIVSMSGVVALIWVAILVLMVWKP